MLNFFGHPLGYLSGFLDHVTAGKAKFGSVIFWEVIIMVMWAL
ncbi:hypothetical protein HU200_064978 [Digitaria exilis]|uniref:Uncharacterized protein n=1 Tax=Digitaria exilis TaxID=1010633 RepID=A0A835A165_9POAL|nr:hypothetical protein HU200_064978 [Digitaria exilis]